MNESKKAIDKVVSPRANQKDHGLKTKSLAASLHVA